MIFLKEVKIKSATWGYLKSKDGKYFTGWVRDKNGFLDWDGVKWEPPNMGMNAVLSGSISIGEVSRGRSAAGCSVTDMEGNEYYMSVGNIVKTLDYVAAGKHHAGQGYITGAWTFAKQGDTISLTPYLETR